MYALYPFIHSCHFYCAYSSPLLYSEALPKQHGSVPEFHAGAPQANVSEGLAQGPYVAARAGVEPMTLRTKGPPLFWLQSYTFLTAPEKRRALKRRNLML